MRTPPPASRSPWFRVQAATAVLCARRARFRCQPSMVRTGQFALVLLLAGSIGAGDVVAESKLLLEAPTDIGTMAATTFDDDGIAVGQSSFTLETSTAGALRMEIELAISGGGVNRSEAILEPIPGEGTHKDQLRLVQQRSQATRADGVSLDLLVIDHVKGRARCLSSSDPDDPGEHIDLPDDDRVVNVPLQLLFQPLARGEVENVRFQMVLCRTGPVLQNMVAVRGPRSRHQDRDVIEIRFGPDLGDAIAWFASRLLPRFSFWFDERKAAYLGHRMPLHRKGPRILLVRSGLLPPDLGLGLGMASR